MTTPTDPQRVATVIVQARLGSVRMPGKVLMPVLGKPLLEHLVERVARARTVHTVVLAIPTSSVNDELEALGNRIGVSVFRGSELDVLDRYAGAARANPNAVIVRVTGDCPLVDPGTLDRVVTSLVDGTLQFVRTGLSFPDGLDVQAFTFDALMEAEERARENYDREHVTPFIEKNYASKSAVLEHSTNLGSVRLTIDEPDDYEVISAVFGRFGHNHFDIDEITSLVEEDSSLFELNRHIQRDAGATLSTGEKLWMRAKRLIPGGNMLLSKRSELFLQAKWPSYYSRSSGVTVWDLDGNAFVDVGYMGIGTNILGYARPEVDSAVRQAVDDGNLSTLNSPSEVFLAERLVQMHPWSDMVKFTRSGGEACAVALRIARAASGKDAVAFCGYHGWHDWYLSANLASESNLDQHLLAGLSPLGVPRALSGTARPFRFNDLDGLRSVLADGEVGTIFMEPERTVPPEPGFLDEVRRLAFAHGAVLVFDESTSGFRSEFGGQHLKYKVAPDIAVFGKTLGNGYAINAVVGSRRVMESACSTFISSTFWTERIGPAAALASLDVMEAEQAPTVVDAIGAQVRSAWIEIASSNGLKIVSSGVPALSTFSFPDYDAVEAKTFVTQEMLKRGFLATTAFYASTAHTEPVLRDYLHNLEAVLADLASAEPADLRSRLDDGPARSGFKRLN